MRNDTISRGYMLEQVVEKEFDWRTPYATGYNDAVRVMREKVWSAPSLDVEPVVRCKDCVYANSKYSDNFILCDIWGEDIPRDGYCYCGKRMGGEDK